MPKVFSQETLEKFADASASIPLRQMIRAFEAAAIGVADDPGGGLGGARRIAFRRYVASIDQRRPRELQKLGRALGALIDEVADSKKEYLITAAERDGFAFADGAFMPSAAGANSFAVTRVEEFGSIEERSRRLLLLADDAPKDAIARASELVESVCRTVLQKLAAPAPAKKASLAAIIRSTIGAMDLTATGAERLGIFLGTLDDSGDGASRRNARLAIGSCVTFARFIAESYTER